jgi:tetratricopeptide (TPR) repeat protein
LGGMPYVHQYNKKRSEQFGFDNELTVWTMYALVRAALRDDKIDRFEYFMNYFDDYQFAQKVQIRRVYELGDFYVKYNKHDKAIAFYQKLIKREPDNARLQNALGDIYLTLKDKQKAKSLYQKAVDLATKQNDRRLADYQQDLKSVL